ncbi:MAG: aminotransferase class IV family protein [Deltaproteobacteria bacterium]|nr:aminotransferase class IV family protein [Deltaproteobacteria bacterium]
MTAQKTRYLHLNGKLVPVRQAAISPLDRGFLYGDGVFESIRAYRGALPFLDEHMGRIRSSLDLLGIRAVHLLPSMEGRISSLLKANRLMDEDAFVRIQISRGPGRELGLSAHGDRPTVLVIAYAIGTSVTEKQENGISTVTVEGLHTAGAAKVKFSNYARSLLALREAGAQKSDDAIFVDEKGRVAEGSTASIFCVKGRTLHTPPLSMGLLPGITRQIVLDIAPMAGLAVKEKTFGRRELYDADEVFFTASISEIYPVRTIDGRKVKNFAKRPVTRRLLELYRLRADRDIRRKRR